MRLTGDQRGGRARMHCRRFLEQSQLVQGRANVTWYSRPGLLRQEVDANSSISAVIGPRLGSGQQLGLLLLGACRITPAFDLSLTSSRSTAQVANGICGPSLAYLTRTRRVIQR